MWQNWSGNIKASPRQQLSIDNEAALQAVIQAANDTKASIRVVGRGHSFVPLCPSDDVLIHLDGLVGVLAVDAAAAQATIAAGNVLSSLGESLHEAGLAMQNLGDIDAQSLAGAIATGTHGTGATLGSLSSQVVGLHLLTATGELVACSASLKPDLFKAAQVSLGALGIVTRVTLQLLPAYRLHERSWTLPFEDCMAQLDDLIAHNRHFEFFWLPAEDICAIKTLNPTELERPPQNVFQPKPSAAAARYVQAERVDWSYRIFPTLRERKFNEQEFAVAAQHGPACLRELRELMQRKHHTVQWPIEYRTVAADDIPLSPFYQRDSVTLSVHQAAHLSYRALFEDTEAIFRKYQGRPHWGKIHTHRAAELRARYPAWESFQILRQEVDPEGRFVNAYLKQLFGLV